MVLHKIPDRKIYFCSFLLPLLMLTLEVKVFPYISLKMCVHASEIWIKNRMVQTKRNFEFFDKEPGFFSNHFLQSFDEIFGRSFCRLTVKWPRYFYSRWCPRGGGRGSMEPPWENHFPTRILQWNLHHICTGYKKSQFFKKKKKKKRCSVSKWRPNNRFLFRVISILAKFWKKTHFPKGIFQWILAQRRRIWIDLHYWNKIFK